MMERAELDAVLALCKRATKGPWLDASHDGIVSEVDIGKKKPYRHMVIGQDTGGACGDPDCCPQDLKLVLSAEDRAFIVASRALVPQLVEEVLRLRRAKAELTIRMKDCPWHPGKHAWHDCPVRCHGYCERATPGRMYVNARWRCKSRINRRTGRCRNGHENYMPGTIQWCGQQCEDSMDIWSRSVEVLNLARETARLKGIRQ